jgi:hypothetical protein
MTKLIDRTGNKYHHLTVMSRAGSNGGKATWNCVCVCGTHTVVSGSDLTTGNTRSCGCLRVKVSTESLTTHGGRKTRLYRIWCAMKGRCLNPNSSDYVYYGGRGITVNEDWINSFAVFRDWALAAGYTDNLTIERVEVNGNYCPENCAWVTQQVQTRNRRKTSRKTSSKYIGVQWHKVQKKWVAMITVDGKAIRIGSFATEDDAGNARNAYIITNNLKDYILNEIH